MKQLSLLALCVCTLASCVKERENVIPTPKAQITQITDNSAYPANSAGTYDGFFSLSSFATHATQDYVVSEAQFTGTLIRNGNSICIGIDDNPSIDKDGIWQAVLNKKDCSSYSVNRDQFSVWGTDMNFRCDATTFGNLSDVHIYMPAQVKIKSPVWDNDQVLRINDNMTWNTDTKNENGDLVTIEYDPTDLGNEFYANTSYPNRIVQKYYVPNSLGSINFTAKMLAAFPAGCRLYISVSRYNTTTYHNYKANENYQFMVGSMVQSGFRLVK